MVSNSSSLGEFNVYQFEYTVVFYTRSLRRTVLSTAANVDSTITLLSLLSSSSNVLFTLAVAAFLLRRRREEMRLPILLSQARAH